MEDVLLVQGIEISYKGDFISLTDIVSQYEEGSTLIDSWLRNKNTIEFLGVWERLNNPDFNESAFATLLTEAGLNRFRLPIRRWTKETNGKGIYAKAGRYGSGTFAHKDIAIEFCSWLNPEFKLYLITELQRLKQLESQRTGLEWNVKRILAKTAYRIHTDAVQQHLIPEDISKREKGFIYASEADVLNVAMFGKTAKEFRLEHPDLKGNLRDFASIEQLTVLSQLESQNALLIEQGMPKEKRALFLNAQAIKLMNTLIKSQQIERLKTPLLDN